MASYQPNDRQIMNPKQARTDIRNGNHFLEDTSGRCSGFTQVNIAMLPEIFANDFEGFCHTNSGPMPLLFRSEPGQFTAPHLGDDIDIRTDMGAYEVLENGVKTEIVENLMKFMDRIQRHVTFYLGCSFSFEKEYLDAGLPLRATQQKRSTPLYLTNVKCESYGVFNNCQQFVSLRPIPKNQLALAVKVTVPMSKYHGAPMHIGDPGMIGIDLSKPDLGEVVDFEEGDVPVFWSCGATGIPAIKNCGAKLGFTQAENCLLITDRPTEKDDIGDDLHVEVVEVNHDPFFASIISGSKLKQIKSLIENKEITKLDDALKSVLALSHSNKVAIVTDQAPNITIGKEKFGLLVLLEVLAVLKMHVVVLVHANSSDKFVKKIEDKLLSQENIKIEQLPNIKDDNSIKSTKYQEFDYILAGDLQGNMMATFVDHVRKTSPKTVTFTGITENGIDENFQPDFYISTGYQNGCELLACLLVTLRSCPIHERYQRRNVGYPQSNELTQSLQTIIGMK